MKMLTADDFERYFKELNGYDPFTWQQLFARQVCDGGWPNYLKAPTASGKTSLLDIAVFAMALEADKSPEERQTPRRIFFVVDRRIVVDETFERAKKIAIKIKSAKDNQPVLKAVQDRLLQLSNQTGPPLDCVPLRGGIYRDNGWVRSAVQPTLISSTVDQVSSRLLFRGYGVSQQSRPIHAALVACDSLTILDEAHLSQPFSQTLREIQRYHVTHRDRWATEPISAPLVVIEMTATPPESIDDDDASSSSEHSPAIFSLDSSQVKSAEQPDGRDALLVRRMTAKKLTLLDVEKHAKGKTALKHLADKMTKHAKGLLSKERSNIAIMVNRIATARMAFENLNAIKGDDFDVELVIGRMRPIDRDRLTECLQDRLATGKSRKGDRKNLIVVSTQCLEVGADFDFDGLVSECASLDALRQRFGRLNRNGDAIEAHGVIVIRTDQETPAEKIDAAEAKDDFGDPIYGHALSRTWNWLNDAATDDEIDFGIASMDQSLAETADDVVKKMGSPKLDAPILFPAYLDRLCQTLPTPVPDPDISLFLHGPQRQNADVQVCWRADLENTLDTNSFVIRNIAERLGKVWTQAVSLLSPTTGECLSVPINIVRRWLTGSDTVDDQTGDVPNRVDEEGGKDRVIAGRMCLVWRGKDDSEIVRRVSQIRPGDTIVLPVEAGGWNVFGHIPEAPDLSEKPKGEEKEQRQWNLANVDRAESAFRQSRAKRVLRIHPKLKCLWPKHEFVDALFKDVHDTDEMPSELTRDDVLERLHDIVALDVGDEKTDRGFMAELAKTVSDFERKRAGIEIQRYRNGSGLIAKTKHLINSESLVDDEGDELSAIDDDSPISLEGHLGDVRRQIASTLPELACSDLSTALTTAAEFHDLGKADVRFQAMLFSSDVTEAWMQPKLWAKSRRISRSRNEYLHSLKTSGQPKGFRHELLSVQLVEVMDGLAENERRDLILHLIATHHGFARPFAPIVPDDDPPPVDLESLELDVRIDAEQRRNNTPHALAADHVDRFWRMIRRHGWWGLAYLETVLRLADQQVSASYDRKDSTQNKTQTKAALA